jgi:hypothetical protein
MPSSTEMIGQTPAAADALDVDGARDRPVADAPTPQDVTPPRLDPTRYGDWERNGRCIDF